MDDYEQIHVIRRDGELEYRCAYSPFGYELGDVPQESGSLEDAIESMMAHYRKTGRRILPGSRLERKALIPATEDKAREYWHARAQEIAATEEEGRFYDLDAFRKAAAKVGARPHRYWLLAADAAVISKAADYVTHELEVPLKERKPFMDDRDLDELAHRIAMIAEEGIMRQPDAAALMVGLEYLENLTFAYSK